MTTKKIRIYFAGPLFTQAEWQWNGRLAEALRGHGFTVTLPQVRAKPMLYGREKFDAGVLFADNVKGISESDVVLAIFDQPDPDSGTCWECGYAYALGRPIVGLRTDIRATGDDPDATVNLMLSRSCRAFLNVPFNRRDDLSWVSKKTTELIRRAGSNSP